ncbi:glycerate dehydrogenase [Blastomyces silverae]|uniref:Glycerate dehydrogenase n=1 Tax=Blastomyces silverae TaxID=2060906 RepID=A0A0H1BI96_9EURO|nr:glycerate dehydrogenase [Blastomyces silverae]
MRVIAWSSNLTQDMADEKASALGLPAGTFEVVSSKLALFREADVLSVHYVLSERSLGIVGEEELGVMKPTALLVNTSRGPLIGEKALLKTLKEGKIRGAALDVFDLEPLPGDSPWRTTRWGVEGRSEVLLSPHMGYVEEGIMHRWYEEQAENLDRWLNGKEVENKLV